MAQSLARVAATRVGFVTIPAEMSDIHALHETVDTPDGIGRIMETTTFTAEELADLSILAGEDAAFCVLCPVAPRSPATLVRQTSSFNFRSEREVRPLLELFGADRFALRTLGTTRLLQRAIQRLRATESQLGTQSLGAAEAVRLQGEIARLQQQQTSQAREWTARATRVAEEHRQELRDLRSFPSIRAQLANSSARILTLEADLQQRSQDLNASRTVSSAHARRIQLLEAEIRVLEHRLAAQPPPLDTWDLMDYLHEHLCVSGHWRRLLTTLERFRDHQLPPATERTQMTISARDLDDDNCGGYPTRAERASTSASSASATTFSAPSIPVSAGFPPSGLPPSSLGHVSAALSQSSSASVGSVATTSAHPSPAAQPFTPTTIDLTGNPASVQQMATPPAVKSLEARQALPDRPLLYQPRNHHARSARSVTTVTELTAARQLPNNASWDTTRGDIRELMLDGLTYDQSQTEVLADAMLHPEFRRSSLIDMLESATYWDRLDDTPWLRYVPQHYFREAVTRIQSTRYLRAPLRWGSVPPTPPPSPSARAASSPGDDDFMSDWASDESDDSQDPSYVGKPSKGKSIMKTRSQRQQPPSSSGSKRARSTSGSTMMPTRKRTSLPAASPRSSTSTRLGEIEHPSAGQTSWSHYGILVQKMPEVVAGERRVQTVGFPNYMP
ncbi:hypothetical protein BBJ28_00024594, partial [Nothophytophthora sp. Chile5]